MKQRLIDATADDARDDLEVQRFHGLLKERPLLFPHAIHQQRRFYRLHDESGAVFPARVQLRLQPFRLRRIRRHLNTTEDVMMQRDGRRAAAAHYGAAE